jgi:hypothetical protein
MSDEALKTGKIRAVLDGFMSAFDITGGVKTPDLTTGWERDGAAIRGDWQRVGDDMRRAMNIHKQQAAHEQQEE